LVEQVDQDSLAKNAAQANALRKEVRRAAYLIYLGIRTLRGGTRRRWIPSRERISLRAFLAGSPGQPAQPKDRAFLSRVSAAVRRPGAGHATLQIFELGVLFALMGWVSDSIWATIAGTFGTHLRATRVCGELNARSRVACSLRSDWLPHFLAQKAK